MRVASWNIEGRLSRFADEGERGSPEHILAGIEALDADILFLPEAFDAARPVEPVIQKRLTALHYALFDVAYNDRGDRSNPATKDPHMLLLSRLEVAHAEELPLVGGIRSMLAADIIDPDTKSALHVVGVHFDDRTEEKRHRQVQEIVSHIQNAQPAPIVAMGDFNAMHGTSFPAFLFGNRVAKRMFEHVPSRRFKDALQRVSEMAIGDTLRMFEQGTGLVAADPDEKSTATPKMRGMEWMPSIRMAKIDHVYVSPNIETTDFMVSRDGGSDHRAISVTTRQNR